MNEANTVALTAATFRDEMQQFEDELRFPDTVINAYLDLAFKQLDPARWGDLFRRGQLLFSAHFITLESADIQDASAGKAPGVGGTRVVSSKSVGSASISYDNQTAMEANAGHWNSTSYGRQFIRFSRLAGMGAIQIQ